jgi:Protein of unknown function (DUF3089)
LSGSARTILVAVLALAAFLLVSPGAAARTVWLCKPGLKSNPCDPGLRTTYYSPAGKKLRVDTPPATRRPKVDCFYVYPTVSDQSTGIANRRIDPELRSIALYQAARYGQHCRVFAPVYRQRTIAALLGLATVPPNAREIGYRDVREAWRTYLRRHNRGRGVVLVGHSQGTIVLRRLLDEEIEERPRQRSKLVSALLLGGNVTVRRGKDVGGDFERVRACRSRRQLGCVVAFSTFNGPVPEGAFFGRTEGNLEVLCTNPGALGGGSARLTSIYPSEPFAPGTAIALAISILGVTQPSPPTPWAELPGAYTGRCSKAGGASVLQTAPRAGAPAFTPSPEPSWGLHLTDANIALGELVDLVEAQVARYVKRSG